MGQADNARDEQGFSHYTISGEGYVGLLQFRGSPTIEIVNVGDGGMVRMAGYAQDGDTVDCPAGTQFRNVLPTAEQAVAQGIEPIPEEDRNRLRSYLYTVTADGSNIYMVIPEAT